MEEKTKIESEELAYWHFRLNGFLTIRNFVVHPDRDGTQRTEVDILGVRFPYRAELFEDPMRDDEVFTRINGKLYVLIAEVKPGACQLNGPWTRPEEQNVHRILRAIGAFVDGAVDEVAQKLYQDGIFENTSYYVSLFCVGDHENIDLRKRYRKVRQKLWDDILKFIYYRFERYERQKSHHPQWDSAGQELWDTFRASEDPNEFVSKIRTQLMRDNSR